MPQKKEKELRLVTINPAPLPPKGTSLHFIKNPDSDPPTIHFKYSPYKTETMVDLSAAFRREANRPIKMICNLSFGTTFHHVSRVIRSNLSPSDIQDLERSIEDEISAIKKRVRTQNERRLRKMKEIPLPKGVLEASDTLRTMGRGDVTKALKKFATELLREQPNLPHLKHNAYLKSELEELALRLTAAPHIIFLDYSLPRCVPDGEFPETEDRKVTTIPATTSPRESSRHNAHVSALRNKWLGDSRSSYNISREKTGYLNHLFSVVLEAHDRHALDSHPRVPHLPAPYCPLPD